MLYKRCYSNIVAKVEFRPFCVLLITQRQHGVIVGGNEMRECAFFLFLRRGPPLFASQSLDEQRVIGFVIIVYYLISLAGFIAI